MAQCVRIDDATCFCWNNKSTGKDPILRLRRLTGNLIAAVILASELGRLHVREKGLKAKWNRRNAQLPCVCVCVWKGKTGEKERKRQKQIPTSLHLYREGKEGRKVFFLRRDRPSTR